MAFIHKYILFPRRFGFAPYLWLQWLWIPLIQMFPYHTGKEKLALILLMVFAWFYRNSWIVTPQLQLWVIGQYLLALVLIYLQEMFFLFLFPAWVIGSLPVSKKLFRQYVVTYYAFVAAGLLLLVRQVPLTVLATFITSSHHGDLITSLVFLLFVLLSPLGGRSIRNTYVRSGILKQQNKRYEMLIRRGERDRIARDLHDTLGQSFATITLKTELACKLLTRDPVAVKQQLVEIQAASRGNLTLVREIVTDLRQVTLTEVLVNLTDKLAGLNISLITQHEELAQKWPVAVQETIAAVLQEALTNVMQYSRADEVKLIFVQEGDQALVTISDNGSRFGMVRTASWG